MVKPNVFIKGIMRSKIFDDGVKMPQAWFHQCLIEMKYAGPSWMINYAWKQVLYFFLSFRTFSLHIRSYKKLYRKFNFTPCCIWVEKYRRSRHTKMHFWISKITFNSNVFNFFLQYLFLYLILSNISVNTNNLFDKSRRKTRI